MPRSRQSEDDSPPAKCPRRDHSREFSEPWEDSDVCFIVEDQKVHAVKSTISMWSPVFRKMFRSDFKERNTENIPLPDKKFDDMVEFMTVLHPPNKRITDDNVMAVLPLCHEYQIDSLTLKCEDRLLKQSRSVLHCWMAQTYDLERLLDDSKDYLKTVDLNILSDDPDFPDLDKDIILEVLMDRCKALQKKHDDIINMIQRRSSNCKDCYCFYDPEETHYCKRCVYLQKLLKFIESQ